MPSDYATTDIPTVAPTLSHDQLMAALYWIHDMMDRANMKFFLAYDTAEAVLQKKDLSGASVQVGVRDLDWNSGSKGIINAFATSVSEDDKRAIYMYEGVPITIYILPQDVCIESCDTVLYRNEYFRLPNPYKQFMELYPLWK